MRRFIQVSSICIAAMSIIWLTAQTGQADKDNIFRLHVIANSDSAQDQATKIKVRDAILEYENENMEEIQSAQDIKEMLFRQGSGLMDTIESTLADSGADYGAELRIGTYGFPDREYMDKLYPAGDYQALRVVLGKGNGQNWWCVLFPPLCILELKDGEIEGDKVKMESLIFKLIKEGAKGEKP